MSHPAPALAGRVVVIIGGSTGLGLSGARACRDAGARVVITGRNRESLAAAARELGEGVATLGGDATDPTHAPAAIALAEERFGGFHALYHVAGGSGRRFGDGPLHELTDEGIRGTLELNLHSVMLSNRAAVRAVRAPGAGGSVINRCWVVGGVACPP
ncbi:MAG: SDR family NAD(P)-dependent oxidoreductase, partial [Opitutaceae bacterium]